MKLYRIRNWNDHYENNRTRELLSLSWIPIPNNHDGDGYTQVMSEKNGLELFGAWIVLVQVASKCGNPAGGRGDLIRGNGKPHDASSIARISRVSEMKIQAALDYFSASLDWLTVNDLHEIPPEGAVIPQASAGIPPEGALNGREGKEGKEVKDVEPVVIPDSLNSEPFLEVWAEWQTYRKKRKVCRDWPGLWRRQLAQLSEWGVSGAIASLRASMMNDWQGLFEPKNGSAPDAGKITLRKGASW